MPQKPSVTTSHRPIGESPQPGRYCMAGDTQSEPGASMILVTTRVELLGLGSGIESNISSVVSNIG